MNLTEKQKQWVAWIAMALVITLISTFLGVKYPIPQPPPFVTDEEIVILGTTHFTNIEAEDVTATDDLEVADDAAVGGDFTVTGSTSWGCSTATITNNLILTGTLTAEDATITDTLNVDGDIDLDGDGFDVNITDAFSIDGDAASNINVAGAGVTLTLESEEGTIIIKGDEATADAIHLDANDAVTTGIDIDVGSVSGLTIDGGLVDIGGGTCGVADGDNDVCIAGVLEVDDELELDGALDADSTANIAGAVTLQSTISVGGDITFENGTTLGEAVDTVLDLSEFLAFTEQTAISVTAQAYLTPTGTYQPLTSAAAVSTSLTTAVMSGTVAGQLLILVNENASDAITIVDGANTAMGGDKVLTGGQGDAIWLMWDLTNWICVGYNDN